MPIKYNFEAAREAGMSDNEIVDYLQANFSGEVLVTPTGRLKYDFAKARKAGMPDSDIVDFLSHAPPTPPEDTRPDMSRGFSTATKQVPQTLYGLLAGAGALGETLFGEDGISSGVKQFGVKKYQEWGAEIAADSKPTDSLTYSYNQAVNGDPGALVDWMQYAIGNTGAQVLQSLASFGIGGMVGKAVGKEAVARLAGGMISKEAARILEQKAGKELTEEALKEAAESYGKDKLAQVATANVAAKIGQNVGMASQALGMEGGEIFGGLSEKSVAEGRVLSGEELAKAFGATIGAGALEFVGDKLGVDIILGKSKFIKAAPGMAGWQGKAARGAVAAAGAMPIEAGTEFAQTYIEEWGKSEPITDETLKHAIDAAGLGAVGGGQAGIIGGALSKPVAATTSSDTPRLPDTADQQAATIDIITNAPTVDDAIAAAQTITQTHGANVMAEATTPAAPVVPPTGIIGQGMTQPSQADLADALASMNAQSVTAPPSAPAPALSQDGNQGEGEPPVAPAPTPGPTPPTQPGQGPTGVSLAPDLPEKLAAAFPDSEDSLEKARNVADTPEGQAAAIILDKVGQKADAANGLAKKAKEKGSPELAALAEKTKQEAIANGEALRHADGPLTEALVDHQLAKFTEPSSVPAPLPTDLAGAKPNYGLNKLIFESDIDRAAYITAQKTKSSRDTDYLNYAMQQTGMDEAAVRAHGEAVKAAIKTQIAGRPKGEKGGEVTVPKMALPERGKGVAADGRNVEETHQGGIDTAGIAEEGSVAQETGGKAQGEGQEVAVEAPEKPISHGDVSVGDTVYFTDIRDESKRIPGNFRGFDGDKVVVVYDGGKQMSLPSIRVFKNDIEAAASKPAETPPITHEPATGGADVVTPKEAVVEAAKSTPPDMTMKQQKTYLLSEIDNAIADAPEYVKPVVITPVGWRHVRGEIDSRALDWSRTPSVYIEVPGDGRFRIINSRRALEHFRRQVEESFPVGESRAQPQPSVPRGKTKTASEPEAEKTKKPTKTQQRVAEKETYLALKGKDEIILLGDKTFDEFKSAAESHMEEYLNGKAGEPGYGDLLLKLSDDEEFWQSLYKSAQKAYKAVQLEKNRDPKVYAGAVSMAWSTVKGDYDFQQFELGFKHALAGKTKSTLPAGDSYAAGYDKSREWMKTPEGAAWYEGKRVDKLENTGVDLRRWFEQQKAELAKTKPDDMEEAWAKIEKATTRAEVFNPVIPEGATPGMKVYVEELRSNLRTFKEMLRSGNGALRILRGTVRRAGMGRRFRVTDAEYIRAYIKGDVSIEVYNSEARQWSGMKQDAAQRLETLKSEAEWYMDNMKKLSDAISGAMSVKEASVKLSNMLLDMDNMLTPLGAELNNKIFDMYATDYLIASKNSRLAKLIENEQTITQKARKESITRPRLDKVTRAGLKDYRQGRDVTTQQAKDTFGFADIVFGDHVKAREDQDHLNYAYDAFMDLADALGIPPKAMGLGGSIHFTIGALGSGGKAAAQYINNQPHPDGGTVPAINVTNTKGDGTVAHEWAHALDYHQGMNGYMKSVSDLVPTTGPIRDIVGALSRNVMSYEEMQKRVDRFLKGESVFIGSRNKHMENARTWLRHGSTGRQTNYKFGADVMGKDYWGNERELFARAFEAYIFDKLAARDAHSDYLVTDYVREGKIKPPVFRGTPYPAGEDRIRFAKYFDAMLKSIVVTDKGTFIDKEKWEANRPKEKEQMEADKKALLEGLEARKKELEQEKKAKEQEAADKEQAEEAEAEAEAQRIKEMLLAQMQQAQSVADDVAPDAPMSEGDILDLLDEADAEETESQHEPTPAGGEKLKNLLQGGRSGRLETNKEKDARDKTDVAAATLAKDFAKHGVTGVKEVLDGLSQLFGGSSLRSFPGGIDEDTYRKAKPHFEAALKAFREAGSTAKELFKVLIRNFGSGIKPYVLRFALEVGLSKNLTVAQEVSGTRNVSGWVRDNLVHQRPFTADDLFSRADTAFGGTMAAGKYSVKDAYDAMEAGVNLYLLETYGQGGDKGRQDMWGLAPDIARNIGKLVDTLPTQTKRTAEMDEFQQFSTPPHFAFVANWAANIAPGETYLEPSAGTGDLAIWGKVAGANVVVNELSQRRASVLREVLPNARIFTENAEQLNNILPQDIRPTVIVMNPPFSATAGRVEGQRSTSVGAQHVEQALARLEEGGRLVAIVGEGMAADKPAFKLWWSKTRGKYNVRANITVDGKNYQKYGTTFSNQIIVIDKTGRTTGEVATGRVDYIQDLIPLLKEIRNDRTKPRPDQLGEPVTAQQGGEEVPASGLESGRGGNLRPEPDTMGLGERGGSDTTSTGDAGPAASGGQNKQSGAGEPDKGSGISGGSRGPGVRLEGAGKAEGTGGSGGVSAGEPIRPDSRGNESTGLTVSEAEGQKAQGELTDSVYENYTPQRLSIPEAQPHKGPLVQSAAMAAVNPPAPTYTPNLPREVITEGKLSIAQIEVVVYAGQAHEHFLPSGERKGFFIGDGTGVGKGREISGILLDNLRQGRKKAVWISASSGLVNDAKRDFGDIGGDPGAIFELGKTKAGESVKQKDGIAFLAYHLLKSGEKAKANDLGQKEGKSRLKQLQEWLGEDFDGVVAFDEAHQMGNAIAIQGGQGTKKPSQRALAGLDLQKAFPKARVVYVSATGATEVANLSYADRLGLWGEDTSFASKIDFISQMDAGGIAAMELVAQNMKAMGVYIARSLSFAGVTYTKLEHDLTPLQHDIYNELAGAWQAVLRNLHAALEVTQGSKDGRAKAAALSRFWGTHQRFFNHVITSMMMPSIVEEAKAAIANGEAVVMQFVNTNEAEQERQVAKAKEEDTPLEELDFTPRQALIEYVRNGFPVQQYQEQSDGNGGVTYVPVMDSQGNPVFNREAIKMRDDLLKTLEDIRVPDNPLDMIVEAFGHDDVAEVSGRGRRFVKESDGRGGFKIVEQKRGKNSSRADADAFMADKKKVLVFTEAGGTGYSFHADNTKANKRRRNHFIVQMGWRADTLSQFLGRTHRTNQDSAPKYILPTTNLKAQKRFISSIARRLDQLGALTRGQRQTGSQGLFSAMDNLESKYASEALRIFFNQMYHGQSHLKFSEVTSAMGLNNLIDPRTGALNESRLPQIPQLLNRLLSLTVEMQDEVFDEFSKHMEELIAKAMENGTYDAGIETVRALKVSIDREETVYTDGKSGATTNYVQLELTHPTHFNEFDTAKKDAMFTTGSRGFFRDARSGKVHLVINRGSRMDASGRMVARGVKIGVSGHQQYIDNADHYDVGKVPTIRLHNADVLAYQDLDYKEAEQAWEAEKSATPKTRTEESHMIVGAILPIWDRLIGEPKIMRTQTQDGRRLIGRMVANKDVAKTLKNLGVGSAATIMPPEKQLARILDGDRAKLSNGWTIKRKRVTGDTRLEIEGRNGAPMTPGDAALLIQQGAIYERINWQDRYFIPTGEDMLTVFRRITENKPVVDLHTGDAPAFSRTSPSAEPWYFSQLSRSVEQAPDKVFSTGKQVAAWLQSNKGKLGVRDEELHWTGVLDWLNMQGKVSKADVLEILKGNGVQVQEVEKGGVRDLSSWHSRNFEQRMESERGAAWRDTLSPSEERHYRLLVEGDQGEANRIATKFAKWLPPGGEEGTYRELLLTLPVKFDLPDGYIVEQGKTGAWFVMYKGRTLGAGGETREDAIQKARFEQGQGGFRSSHWGEPNILAHLRVDEVIGEDGKRYLRVIEAQSDWGQKGRETGFKGLAKEEQSRKEKLDQVPAGEWSPEDIDWYNATVHDREQYGVPTAPFVTDTKSWVALAIKRATAYAAEKGLDGVVFATGQQNVEIYRESLRKAVDRIEWTKQSDGIRLVGFKNDMQVVDTVEQENAVSDAIGKSMGEQIINDPDQSGVLEGDDITISDTGMAGFYDRIVPQVANDVLRKIGGGKVSDISILSPTQPRQTSFGPVWVGGEFSTTTNPGFTITPQMRETILAGLPLFKKESAKTGTTEGHHAAIEQRIATIRQKWANAPEVVVARNMDDEAIPQRVRDYEASQQSQGATGTVEGFYYGSKVYLLTDEITDADRAETVLIHETIGHAGLRGVFGEELKPVLRQITLARRSDVAAKAREYGLDMAKESDRLIAAEEVLAELAQTDPQLNIVQRAIAAIRAWLREHGVSMEMTDNDIIYQFIIPARGFIEKSHGRIRGGLTRAAVSGDTDSIRFQSAYHGSPYHFDKFTLEHIGKGEGAQAYGWGLYFAGKREIAEYYKNALSKTTRAHNTFDGEKITPRMVDEMAQSDDKNVREFFRGFTIGQNLITTKDLTVVIKEQISHHEEQAAIYRKHEARYKESKGQFIASTYTDEHYAEFAAGHEASAKATRRILGRVQHIEESKQGRLYKVELAPQENEYLLWDKPLSEQGDKVLSVLKGLQGQTYQQTGHGIYQQLVTAKGGQRAASEYLRSLGIPGIKYMDGSSRGKGEGSYNYVIFDEALVDIQEVMFSRAQPVPEETGYNGILDLADNFTKTVKTFGPLKGVMTQLHKARIDKEHFGPVFNLAMAFRNDLSRIAHRTWRPAQDVLPAFNEVKGAVRAILHGKDATKEIQRVSQWIFDGTTHGGASPMGGIVWTPKQLREKFNATDKEIGIYQGTRESIDSSLDEVANSVAWRLAKPHIGKIKGMVIADPRGARDIIIDALTLNLQRAVDGIGYKDNEAAQEAVREISATLEVVKEAYSQLDKLKAAGYAPLQRFGRYTVDVFETTKNGKIARDDDDNPKRFEFQKFEFEAEARAEEKRLRAKYANNQNVLIRRGIQAETKLFAGVDPETVLLFIDQVSLIDGIDIKREALDEWRREAISQRSALTRQIKRKGIAGYSQDLPRVLATFLTSNARYASSNYHMADMRNAIGRIPDAKGDVKDEADDLYDYINTTNEPGAWMRGLMFAWYLGGSPAAAIVNMTQPVLMTFPYLSQFGNAGKYLIASTRQAMGKGPLSLEMRAQLQRAMDEGIVEAQEVHHLYDEGMRPIIARLPGGEDLRARVQGVATLWGAWFGMAENFNRRITFLSAYKMAEDMGDATLKAKGFDGAYDFARKAVEETQGVYSKENRPNWARGTGPLGLVGVAAFTFKQYSIQYVELLMRMYGSGPEGKKAAFLMLGLLVLASGLQGAPGADDLDDLIDTVLQSMGYKGNIKKAKRDALRDLAGERMAEIVMYGLSAETPLDVQSRLGLGNLLPATGALKPSETNKARQFTEILGPPGSFAGTAMDFTGAVQSGKTGSAFGAFAPVFIRNIAKAYHMADSGLYADTRGRKVADVSLADAAIKLIGFQPQSVAAPTKAAQLVRQDIARVKGVESGIADIWAEGMFEKDVDKIKRAKDRLREWNETNRETPIRITFGQIHKRVQAMKSEKADRMLKTAPGEMRGYVRDGLQ